MMGKLNLTYASRSKFTAISVFNLWYRAYYNINMYPIINNMLDQNFGGLKPHPPPIPLTMALRRLDRSRRSGSSAQLTDVCSGTSTD